MHVKRIFQVTCFLFIMKVGFSQNTTSKNIMDYYLRLPIGFFACEDEVKDTEAFRRSKIVKENIKNGYILATVEGYKLQVALFKDKINGRDIIAAFEECGPGCMCLNRQFVILQPNGTWIDVYDEIMPSEKEIFKTLGYPEDKDIYFEYVIPEFGTTIKLLDWDTQEHLANLKWIDGKFKCFKAN